MGASASTPASSSSAPPPSSSSPPSSSPSISRQSLMTHEVFISFRGEDTRAKFISHLEAKFKHHGIETFVDDRLHKGDTIAEALFEAIKMSKISVVVFSENFASSSWCLDEVLCIRNCMDSKEQVVVPIFYDIDPSNVRRQLGRYKAAFVEHRKRSEVNKVEQWRSALTRVANISGWDSKNWRNEAEFVEALAKDIKRKLNRMSPRDDFKDIVGMDTSVEKMEELLCIGIPTVRTVGIWGMGGLGKTTLARVVFEQLSSKFQGRCLLEGVREESEMPDGLNKLKKKLYSVLLDENDLDEINTFTAERLRCKKVLIVLDDVNQADQLEVLAGDVSSFCPGSRIVVTTRDQQVLRDRADASYELEPLNPQDALELFHLHAFKRRYSPTESDMNLSKTVVNYADGIPLALKVLGSFLRSRRKENWILELKRLREVPNEKVHSALKISYDGLDREEKKVFLDIVCFFVVRGRISRHCVDYNLAGNGFNKKVEIDNLIDKSLIVIRDNYLIMHDLIREMGWEIAQQHILEEPPNRGLWSEDNVYRDIEYSIGTGALVVKGMPCTIEVGPTAGEVDLIPTGREETGGPQFLSMTNICFTQRLQYLPSTLRTLKWDRWPLTSLPTRFMACNLVMLVMPFSQLTHLWDGNQDLGNLKYVDLSGSNVLTDISGLSHAPSLEVVILSACESLRQVPLLSFQNLNNQSDYICNKFECGRSLSHLVLRNCIRVKVLEKVQGDVVELNLSYTSLEELPSSICSLHNLAYLYLDGCCFLKNLPSDIQSLKSLKHLSLRECSSFDNLPVLPMNVTTLNLSHTSIQKVPSSSIEHLSSLKEFYLNNCGRLEYVSYSICKLKSLILLDLSCCKELKFFPEISQPMECLETLNLQQTGILKLPSSFVKLTGLKKLYLSDSRELMSLPNDIHKLKSLTHLQLSNCKNLTIFPEILQPMECLRRLGLSGSGIRVLPLSIKNLIGLEELDLDSCKNLEILPITIYCLNHLQSLRLSNCFKLDLNFCMALEIPNGICGIVTSLEKLYLRDCLIDRIPAGIQQLSKLIVLDVYNCKCLKSLPSLPLSLEQVTADGCVALTTVSTSLDVLLRDQWSDDRATKCRTFSFYGCSDMDQRTRVNMVCEFRVRVWLTASRIVSNRAKFKELSYPCIGICLPGNQIPKWFTYQSNESFVNVSLPSDWLHGKFFGFALCVLVARNSSPPGIDFSLSLSCSFHFITSNNGKSPTFDWEFGKTTNFKRNSVKFKSDNLFMWYKHEDYDEFRDATEACFRFSAKTNCPDSKVVATGVGFADYTSTM